ncbi:MAG: DUF368 domain-containing protein, partial [Pirellulales bacterium]
MHEAQSNIRSDLLQIGRGCLMGGADVVPGVSGGTVALIVGIYQRLVLAISRFDMTFISLVVKRDFRAAAVYVDLRFLMTLGIGVGLGIVSLARLMQYLLSHHYGPTWSVFFGLIVASSVLVAGLVQTWRMTTVLAVLAGAIFAYWLVGQLPQSAPAGQGYTFLCGVIGVSAMILPGISGSFILVLMGKYYDVIGAVSRLTERTANGSDFVTLGVFAVGCAVGLLMFSKLLRWLLANYADTTMAVLCGFMFGSLRKIWPFKKDITSEGYLRDVFGFSDAKMAKYLADPASLKVKYRLLENASPAEFESQVVATYIGLAVAAALFVFLLHWIALGRSRKS